MPASGTALAACRFLGLARRLLGRQARLFFHLDAVPFERFGARLRRLQADTAERALAVILQQHVGRLFVVEVAAAHAETAPRRHTLDHADAVHALGLEAVAFA